MASTLTVNGTAYNQAGRKSARLIVDGWGWDLDGGAWLEFSEYCAGPQPLFSGPVAVSLNDGTATRFSGDIVSVQPAISEHGRTWGYRCAGLDNRANWIPVTAVDGSGRIAFNVDPTQDPDSYLPSFAGKTVGQIISYCLTQHATALTAAGITTDATTASQLAALSLVPSESVEVCGERLWQALEGVLLRWARNQRLVILGSGLVRVVDVSGGSTHTLTLGTDPVDPPLFARNWAHTATRVVGRGRGKIYPGYVSYLRGTLKKAWSGAQETAWRWTDFSQPIGAYDTGSVNSVTSATTITIHSDDTSKAWAANYWNSLNAWIYLTKTSGSGLTYTESRPITASTGLSAGGTATITVGYALDNSASSAYDSYAIMGTAPPLGSSAPLNRSGVWRLYNIDDPGHQIRDHLVRKFPVSVGFRNFNSTLAILTDYPTAEIVAGGEAYSAYFTVDPANGQILFSRPVVEQLNSISSMTSSGASVVPDDIYVLLAYSRGAMTVSYPADISGVPQYSGTGYTAAGLARSAYLDVDSWAYEGNGAQVGQLAQMIQESTRDTIIEGTVRYLGAYSAVLDPSGGHRLSFAGNGYTTGDESLAVPVRSCTVKYLSDGRGGILYETTMRCSTRRDPRTGESFYCHLSVLGSGQGVAPLGGYFAGGAGMAAPVAASGFGGPQSIVDAPANLVNAPSSLVNAPGSLVDAPGNLVNAPASLVDVPGASDAGGDGGPSVDMTGVGNRKFKGGKQYAGPSPLVGPPAPRKLRNRAEKQARRQLDSRVGPALTKEAADRRPPTPNPPPDADLGGGGMGPTPTAGERQRPAERARREKQLGKEDRDIDSILADRMKGQ